MDARLALLLSVKLAGYGLVSSVDTQGSEPRVLKNSRVVVEGALQRRSAVYAPGLAAVLEEPRHSETFLQKQLVNDLTLTLGWQGKIDIKRVPQEDVRASVKCTFHADERSLLEISDISCDQGLCQTEVYQEAQADTRAERPWPPPQPPKQAWLSSALILSLPLIMSLFNAWSSSVSRELPLATARLRTVLCLGLVARASAWARASVTVTGEALADKTIKDYVEEVKTMSPTLGSLQMMGSCCDENQGAAMEVQNGINTNTLYGPTDELAKTIFKDTGCSPVAEKNMNKMGTAGCTYFSIFQNTAHADHEFAANCVPGVVCSADVVGMTKGLIATYGVVMQILQPNLGSLANIYSGPIDKCFAGMNKLNEGNLKDSLVTTPIMGPFNLKLGETTKLVVEGMGHVGALDSLKTCQNTSDVGYLFVHKNLYWSQTEDAVDLEAFSEYKTSKAAEAEEKARQKQMQAIAKSTGKGDTKTAEATLEKAGAEVPPPKAEVDKGAVTSAKNAGKLSVPVGGKIDIKGVPKEDSAAVVKALGLGDKVNIADRRLSEMLI
ncbi:CHLP [Symbiodinium natans]|uniref:CHLP protein n=1 Tax=Symbiodinium natans TaxID=878477 RepID=A0A812S6Q2_9DINO|nr:CHLP [Symbiodinium natans]